jgi:hypothetical protein
MSSIIKDSNGQLVPTVFRPGVSQTFTVTNSSAQSAAFGSFTTMVMVSCSLGHGHIQFGTNPTASVSTSLMMPNNTAMIFSVSPGDKMAVIKDAGVTNCTIGVTEII